MLLFLSGRLLCRGTVFFVTYLVLFFYTIYVIINNQYLTDANFTRIPFLCGTHGALPVHCRLIVRKVW